MFFLYNGLLLLLSPVWALLLALRLAKGKSRPGWSERWGRLRPDFPVKRGSRIWVHAASVGEVSAATSILEELKKLKPDAEIVISTITPGGHETAAALVGRLATTVFYAPFDLPWSVGRSLATVQPDALVIVETEIWPNLLSITPRRGTKTVLVNGRISDRSFSRYLRLRPLFRWALSHVDRILTQTETDAERFRHIGAPRERVTVTGNSKFDQSVDRRTAAEAAELKRELRLPADAPVLVVGSTRTPDEEREVIAAYVEARREFPDLCLIHAPRHVDRADEVSAIMIEAGLNPVRRTRMAESEGPVEHLILDTFGELANVYGLGDVAFIGNSLLPPGGGQNLLQPLAQGKPAIYGPYMQNFRDLTAMAEMAGVGIRIMNRPELTQQLVTLLKDAGLRGRIAEAAVALILANQGASRRYAECIVSELEPDRSADERAKVTG